MQRYTASGTTILRRLMRLLQSTAKSLRAASRVPATVLVACLALICSSACGGNSSAENATQETNAQALIRDSARGGAVPGFFFLPPFIKLPANQRFGTFAPKANPTVTLDQIAPGSVSSPSPQVIKSKVALFTVNSGPALVDRRNRRGNERVRVHVANTRCDDDDDDDDVDANGYFAIRWDTRDANLVDGGVYRLHVQAPVAGIQRELGFADIVVLRKASKARFVDSSLEVPLINNRILR
ncbi:MAG: hypothetical protein ABW061_08925, partial [Polyangiaceae bacterium]